jgi:SAM-dependent methyltransferase
VSSREGDHNTRQRTYFEGGLKRTMVPVDSRYLQRHVDALVRFGGISTHHRILEVGCGMGRYTLLLASRGFRVEGLDLSPVLIEKLRTYGGRSFDVPLYAADIEHPPAELAGSFDVVVALFALHHMEDLPGAFRAMRGLLKPGGRVVFLEPNPYNPLFYLQMLTTPGMSWAGDKGLLKMRRRLLFDGLREAGFESPEMMRFGFLPPFAVNAHLGGRLEAVLERMPFWRPLLPFQLFRARRA